MLRHLFAWVARRIDLEEHALHFLLTIPMILSGITAGYLHFA